MGKVSPIEAVAREAGLGPRYRGALRTHSQRTGDGLERSMRASPAAHCDGESKVLCCSVCSRQLESMPR